MSKILIVDDSQTLRMQLREALEEAGHLVVEGLDGVDGLKRAQENPDLKMVITDFNMPQMDGISMTRKIREIAQLRSIPVLMLTTETTPEIKAAGKEAGIMAWIVKPLVPAKVMPAIAKLLARN